jgi:hypothetical protein
VADVRVGVRGGGGDGGRVGLGFKERHCVVEMVEIGGGQRGKGVWKDKESKGRQAKGEKRIEGKIRRFDET